MECRPRIIPSKTRVNRRKTNGHLRIELSDMKEDWLRTRSSVGKGMECSEVDSNKAEGEGD